jgi:hypothetical protein
MTTGNCMPPRSKSWGGGDEAGVAEGLQRFLDLGNHAHARAVEARLVLVGLAVVRREFLFRHRLRRIEHGEEGFSAVLGVARARGQGFSVEYLEELEFEIAAAEYLASHFRRPARYR